MIPRFLLPLVLAMAAVPSAAQDSGAPLPGWLRFDAATLRFDAAAVPDGAFPMQVMMSVGGQRVVVVISERAE